MLLLLQAARATRATGLGDELSFDWDYHPPHIYPELGYASVEG